MNVILFASSDNYLRLYGSLFDAYEYFSFAVRFNPDLKMWFSTLNLRVKSEVKQALKQRYTDTVTDKISFMNISEVFRKLLTTKIRKLFFFDLSSLRILQQVPCQCQKIFYVTEFTSKDFLLNRKNVVYCSEMPFCRTDMKIRMRFFFETYRKFSEFENNLYVNYPKGKLEEVKDIIESVSKKPVLFKENKALYDLHKHFDEYLYVKSPYWFDPHPRLFHESKFYGKAYHYVNNLNVKDGSYYRYLDSIENDISTRDMTTDDNLIQEMLT